MKNETICMESFIPKQSEEKKFKMFIVLIIVISHFFLQSMFCFSFFTIFKFR